MVVLKNGRQVMGYSSDLSVTDWELSSRMKTSKALRIRT